MTVLSPTSLMTSPISFRSPTSTTSYILGEMPSAVTTGPATLAIFPFFFSAMHTRSRSLRFVEVDSHRPSYLVPHVPLVQTHGDDDWIYAFHHLRPELLGQPLEVLGEYRENPDPLLVHHFDARLGQLVGHHPVHVSY